MKKKILSFIMAACMAAVSLTGCGGSKTEEFPEKLTFTYVTAPLNVPTIIEKEKGIFASVFEDMGIDVEYAELTSGADQTQALASGALCRGRIVRNSICSKWCRYQSA